MVRSPFPLIRVIRIIPAEGLRRRVLHKALAWSLSSRDSSGKWESDCRAVGLSVRLRGHVWWHLTASESQGCKSKKTQSGRRIPFCSWAVLQLAGANKQVNEVGMRGVLCVCWWSGGWGRRGYLQVSHGGHWFSWARFGRLASQWAVLVVLLRWVSVKLKWCRLAEPPVGGTTKMKGAATITARHLGWSHLCATIEETKWA